MAQSLQSFGMSQLGSLSRIISSYIFFFAYLEHVWIQTDDRGPNWKSQEEICSVEFSQKAIGPHRSNCFSKEVRKPLCVRYGDA